MSVDKFISERKNLFISAYFTRKIKIGISVVIFLLILVLIILELPDGMISAWGNIQMSLGEILSQNVTKTLNKKSDTKNLKPQLREVHSETSPDGLREIILYERPFTGDREYEYRSYLNNQYLFAVKEFENGVEREIYIGDYKVGNPHWLGNDFIFFTGGCGTGCKGFYLVDTRSKESFQGVITTTPVSKDGFITYLHDWFDEKFEFVGVNKNIRSVYLDGEAYLIFEMWNNNQYVGEKRFLFTENSLKEL